MDKVIACEYNVDNGYVEVYYRNRNMMILKCEDVEAQIQASLQAKTQLQKLLDTEPLTYVVLALSGELQAYCEIEDKMIKDFHDILLKQYLERGYNEATAEALIREFYRYES